MCTISCAFYSSQPCPSTTSSTCKLQCNFDGDSCTTLLAYNSCFMGESTITSPIASTLVPLNEVEGVNAFECPIHEVGAMQLVLSVPKLCSLPS